MIYHGNCDLPENSQSCPHDCPKGGFDAHCDDDVPSDPDCATALTEEQIIAEFQQRASQRAIPLESERTSSSKEAVIQTPIIQQEKGDDSSKSSAWIIAGLIVMVIVVFLIFTFKRKYKKKS